MKYFTINPFCLAIPHFPLPTVQGLSLAGADDTAHVYGARHLQPQILLNSVLQSPSKRIQFFLPENTIFRFLKTHKNILQILALAEARRFLKKEESFVDNSCPGTLFQLFNLEFLMCCHQSGN